MKYKIPAISIFFAFFMSCATNYLWLERQETKEGLTITNLSLSNEGDYDYDIPLMPSWAITYGQKYIPVRRVNAPHGYEIFVLRGGITNTTAEKISINLKTFLVIVDGRKFAPAANNIKFDNVWSVGLGKSGDPECENWHDIHQVYLLPTGSKPQRVILGDILSIDIPPAK